MNGAEARRPWWPWPGELAAGRCLGRDVWGAAIVAVAAIAWWRQGISDGWWDRITEVGMAVWGPILVGYGTRWLRALRVNPTAKFWNPDAVVKEPGGRPRA